MAKKIDIVEVGPRDGFQNLKEYLPVQQKMEVIDGLIGAGIRHMQITAFVHPKAIPQMKDAAEVTTLCLEKYPNLDLYALVPNFRGAQNAGAIGLKKISTVISLSASHNKANVNYTQEESFAELKKIKTACVGMEVCLDIATAFGCPFEGRYLDEKPLLAFIQRAWDLGVTVFNLCDTVGLANPAQVRRVVQATKAHFPHACIEVHIHDTRGMGLVNTLAAIEEGVDGVQAALGGLGGCPFAPGASGNTATEDLVLMLNQMGYDTGIDFEKLLAVAKYEYETVEGNYSGHHIHVREKQSVDCKSMLEKG